MNTSTSRVNDECHSNIHSFAKGDSLDDSRGHDNKCNFKSSRNTQAPDKTKLSQIDYGFSSIDDHLNTENQNSSRAFINSLGVMDKTELLNMLLEKSKRIQQLEEMLEDQRRLRIQDASQVEEKATKIKEWVANKLKELENQNKNLREQNRKQKLIVETLTLKIGALNDQKASPSQNRAINQDIGQDIRRLKTTNFDKNHPPMSPSRLRSQSTTECHSNLSKNSDSNNLNKHKEFIPRLKENPRSQSPIYDCVNLDSIQKHIDNNVAPPRPVHRVDDWESHIYQLAEKNISEILENIKNDEDSQRSSRPNDRSDADMTSNGLSAFRNDLTSLINPNFTTIDGDKVLDEKSINSKEEETESGINDGQDKTYQIQVSLNTPMPKPVARNLAHMRKINFGGSCENILRSKPAINLFESPMRVRRRPTDTMLRTQSIRKNPVPQKLLEFILNDLIKRGYLMKSGPLKNYLRWYVLKDSSLKSYKTETEEANKMMPSSTLKLDYKCQVIILNQTTDSTYPFKIITQDKSVQLIAESQSVRDNWIKMIAMTINMSNIKADAFDKSNITNEGLVSFTCHGCSRKCYAILTKHIIIFLKSPVDPVPVGYVSLTGAKIREITDSYDYENYEDLKEGSGFQDCHLAIYPKFCLSPDPIYISFGSQQELDKWFYHMSIVSSVDQSSGTPFELALTKIMQRSSLQSSSQEFSNSHVGSGCIWTEYSMLLHTDEQINEPLTSLPNETLRAEAIELFKSVLLFIQVPVKPIAVDYHVSLLQNCLARFLQHPELRNEFYAQLIKQCTYVKHNCPKTSESVSTGSSSGCSPTNTRFSSDSMSTSENRIGSEDQSSQSMDPPYLLEQCQLESYSSYNVTDRSDETSARGGVLRAMQILSLAISLNIPRGRVKWWLISTLNRLADPTNDIGKYALYTLRALGRTLKNGTRENIPSRTEVLSILLRNPNDHSLPHSLPVNFPDGSYLVVSADGSTTVEEFMDILSKDINIRESSLSDFYLFADDPSESRELHILEPHRKIFDIVGWWEQNLRKHNSGRYQSAKVLKLLCKKRLIFRAESGETMQEKMMIVHQANQEVVSTKVTVSDSLAVELAALMCQISFGDFDSSSDTKSLHSRLSRVCPALMRKLVNEQMDDNGSQAKQIVQRWLSLHGRTSQDCVRVYLNCIRRLRIDEC